MLGDRISTALATVGITQERIEQWVGAPCHCKERQEKLNQLDLWARRVVSGKLHRAKEYLEQMVT